MKYINQLNLNGKQVFIRADLNVPFDEAGNIADELRIKESLPTIQYALEAGASVVLASHLGRPKGKPDMKYSLRPVGLRLAELTGRRVVFAPDCVGEETKALADQLKPGEVLLLENVRFHPEEEANDVNFAKQLAEMADVYVNDAFATAHRAHASTAAMAAFFKEKAGGFTMKNELEYFNKALSNPERPLIAIFGGAKVSTKMDAIRNVAKKADGIIIGGAMANTFFAAQGRSVGTSLFEPEQLKNAHEIETELKSSGCALHLPVDAVVAAEMKAGVTTEICDIASIPSTKKMLDIGPKSIEAFQRALSSAKTIVWNGPMGAFEIDEFSAGTYAIVDALANSKALTVVGGGDTDLALHKRHAMEKMSYVSTAGGAFLELLEGKILPAVEALE